MKNRLLTVDDSKTVRILVKKAFKNCELDILEATNGVEGLSVASKEQPDLVLLDVTMPVMDGVEMLTRLKGDANTKQIPVIMLTAEGGRENVLKIAKLGIRDYIVKPFEEEVLVEKVGRVIDLNKREVHKTILDKVKVLLVEDKPAIVDAIKDGLSHLPWEFTAATKAYEGIDMYTDTDFDLVLMSLSLPNDAAFEVIRKMRSKRHGVPIIGMVVKIDSERQHKALQAGFDATVTKPIDLVELETRACRVMGVDTSPKYFQFKDKYMVIKVPQVCSMARISEMQSFLSPKVTEAVDSGYKMVVLDASESDDMDVNLIKFILDVFAACKEISLNCVIVGNEKLRKEGQGFEETKNWKILSSIEEVEVS
ncbi:MAG: response regulator [Puniceicoccaceae bacterium]